MCLNEYTWLEICEKEKWILQEKTKWKKKNKKKWSWTKVKEKKMIKRKKRSRSAIWDLLCKVGGFDVIWKVKLYSTSL